MYLINQAAKKLGVSSITLKRWILDGKVSDVARDRKGWRVFSDDDINEIANIMSTETKSLMSSKKPLKLIEEYFPSSLLSEGSTTERYQRGGQTPHTIFTWWARRPFAAMRGVVACSLIDVSESDYIAKGVIEKFSSESDISLEAAFKELIGVKKKRVLDLFAGGGTIPIVAATIGAESYALDNNQLASFTQKSLLQFSQIRHDLPELVENFGTSLLNKLKSETECLFPARNKYGDSKTLAYFWSRSVQCPKCQSNLSLMKRPWLSKKKGKDTYIERKADLKKKNYSRNIKNNDTLENENYNAWSKNIIICPFCEYQIGRDEIGQVLHDLGFDELTAYVIKSDRGKKFLINDESIELVPSQNVILNYISSCLTELGTEEPSALLNKWSGFVNPSLYGFKTVSDLYNLRQQAVLVRTCLALKQLYVECSKSYGDEVALAITAFLSGFLDQLADWNSRLCMWIPQNEQVGRALSGPGVPMMWDFVETDPFCNGPSNLWGKLDRIVSGLRSIPEFTYPPTVVNGDARNLPFEDAFFDAVVTDPPYFDNIYYNILADFIYIWKQLVFKDILPDLFSENCTNQSNEISSCKYRHGNSVKEANEFYKTGMTDALRQIKRVLKDDGVLSFIYAHSSISGWASIADAFLDSELNMVAAWEMQIERKHRPRGINSNAVNTSFVLVGKKKLNTSKSVEIKEFKESWLLNLKKEYERLLSIGSSLDDIGFALFGISVCFYVQAGNIIDNERLINSQEILEYTATTIEDLIKNFTVNRR